MKVYVKAAEVEIMMIKRNLTSQDVTGAIGFSYHHAQPVLVGKRPVAASFRKKVQDLFGATFDEIFEIADKKKTAA